ncbi:oxidoreductase, short-chain dehydrogenase/reductase family [Aspergillus melleus]|uniref:oxidoreductase, short-chain dehydrogenase/reductase family n=1 Tax=Aspergillus melleus TaxID=138277 RepID=UPI001E8DDBC7|nr:uncharacterized protein LDX57_003208 [Aspergillus melleus]KAH8425455.1 hypothetical protein LDX57_003208 [Aspergillus melleus]
MTGLSFDPATDVPDVTGKIIFITGGTAGIGAATALHLASKKASHIYISGRNAQSASSAIKQVQETNPSTTITFIPCDLADLSSVKTAAQTFLAQESQLDILICNAGIMATPPGISKDGYEIQFATNHLGHALLIQSFLPRMRSTASAAASSTSSPSPTGIDPTGNKPRIILLTSTGYLFHPRAGIAFPTLTTPQENRSPYLILSPWTRYGQSKLANILYARELARRYPDITTVAIHPGVVDTDLIHSLSWGDRAFVYATTLGRFLDREQGAWNSVWAAAVAEAGIKSGGFYVPVGREERLRRGAGDGDLGGRLWGWTEGVIRGFL